MSPRYLAVPLLAVVFAVGVSACSNDGSPDTTTVVAVTAEADTTAVSDAVVASSAKYPNIVSVKATRAGKDWTFDVTVSSPYDTPQRYADGWRVTGPDGEVFGEHTLDHDHASEQPFTRTQSGVSIPDTTTSVTIEGRDKDNGYGGKTVTINLS